MRNLFGKEIKNIKLIITNGVILDDIFVINIFFAARTDRRRTNRRMDCRGQLVADISSHGQNVARTNSRTDKMLQRE
jgi:hypothetical protein